MFDDCGDRGGIAQINIPSLQKTIIAVFVANVYPVNNQNFNFDVLERTENTSTSYIEPILSTTTSTEKHVE